jgi:hypothetical protein|tara:strand:- start:1454 stop:1618 length:165 start_codon:yes stop_codon:yes gene_type:complete
MVLVKEVEARPATHEAVCGERWRETIGQIKRLEKIFISCAGALIALMAALLWKI